MRTLKYWKPLEVAPKLSQPLWMLVYGIFVWNLFSPPPLHLGDLSCFDFFFFFKNRFIQHRLSSYWMPDTVLNTQVVRIQCVQKGAAPDTRIVVCHGSGKRVALDLREAINKVLGQGLLSPSPPSCLDSKITVVFPCQRDPLKKQPPPSDR